GCEKGGEHRNESAFLHISCTSPGCVFIWRRRFQETMTISTLITWIGRVTLNLFLLTGLGVSAFAQDPINSAPARRSTARKAKSHVNRTQKQSPRSSAKDDAKVGDKPANGAATNAA